MFIIIKINVNTVTVSTLIAIVLLVSEIWLATDRQTDSQADRQTDRQTDYVTSSMLTVSKFYAFDNKNRWQSTTCSW